MTAGRTLSAILTLLTCLDSALAFVSPSSSPPAALLATTPTRRGREPSRAILDLVPGPTTPASAIRPSADHRPPTSLGASAATGGATSGLIGRLGLPSLLVGASSRLRGGGNLLLFLLAAATTSVVLLARRASPQTLLWPGTAPDATSDAPLPPGGFGCPLFGTDVFSGSKDYGPYAGLARLARKAAGPIFKLYSFGIPVVSVAGASNVKSLMKNEFRNGDRGIGTEIMGEKNLGPLFGGEAILYENDSSKHGTLRKLAGMAMTPAAIGAAVPSIQEAAGEGVERILGAVDNDGGTIQMEGVFNDYTLDIAWKQILGLDLQQEEVPKFHKAVEVWTKGIVNPMLLLPFQIPALMRLTKVGRARTYLVSKVEEKLARLDENGPDDSTLSKLYFATVDEGGEATRLTRTQVIDNALILIFAGSETSSSTLTCISFLLGLHPDVWKKVKEEQNRIVSEFGTELTAEILDKLDYLDAVIKETLRLHPVESTELRKVDETVVVDDQQIPKGWYALPNIKETHWRDPSTIEKDGSHMDDLKGFAPERWLEDATRPLEWMPFGDGRRRCIGERLAMAEMKVFLSMLARKVEYELVHKDEDVSWQTATVMARPADGVEVRAYPVGA